MNFSQSDNQVFKAILSGKYTSFDVRIFIRMCHDLAIPFVRKKIALGKLNTNYIGLSDSDLIYDCLADLFQRDEQGNFPQIVRFFEKHASPTAELRTEEYYILLRQLICGNINQNIIRIYSELDPGFGKILRNLKLALNRSSEFNEMVRFGEIYIVPNTTDLLLHQPPCSYDYLHHSFSTVALVYDPIPDMLHKLHSVLTGQDEFQRLVPLLEVAALFKSIYALNWSFTDIQPAQVEETLNIGDLNKQILTVCASVSDELKHRYVAKGKVTDEIFNTYMDVITTMLQTKMKGDESENNSYFEYLKARIPSLTKEEYYQSHRTTIEYIFRIVKTRLHGELSSEE